MASVASVAQKFKKLTKKPLEKKNLLPPHQLESGDQRDSGEARAKRKLLDDISKITEIAEKELRQKVALVSTIPIAAIALATACFSCVLMGRPWWVAGEDTAHVTSVGGSSRARAQASSSSQYLNSQFIGLTPVRDYIVRLMTRDAQASTADRTGLVVDLRAYVAISYRKLCCFEQY